jgi:hypothetical protein
MNNLNVALDGAVRALRMGSSYKVSNDGLELSFTPFGKSERWTYTFEETTESNGDVFGRIYKYYKPEGFTRLVKVPITATEVDIDSVKFYVTGTATTGDPSGVAQPRVLLIVRGKAGLEKEETTTTFNIQASATQRVLDL